MDGEIQPKILRSATFARKSVTCSLVSLRHSSNMFQMIQVWRFMDYTGIRGISMDQRPAADAAILQFLIRTPDGRRQLASG